MENKDFFKPADILLPKADFEKWAVIACDQYTSEPEYWQKTAETVGNSKSAFNLILPEIYLKSDNLQRISKINKTMLEYLSSGVFEEYKNSYIYIERTLKDGAVRRGIVGVIDLEDYDYTAKSNAPIRATEETVIERIPPRVNIRRNASIELPHIMLLADDKEKTVVEPLQKKKQFFKKLYDFELMQNGGSISGYLLDEEAAQEVRSSVARLAKASADGPLFVVGDGNHSLATAKECYRESGNPLARYALVELVNLHDDSLKFEPIYRVLFGADPERIINSFTAYCGGQSDGENAQKFTFVTADGETTVAVAPKAKLSVATLQPFLDRYIKENPEIKIDYIHGTDSLRTIAKRENAVGIIFNGMEKDDLFDAVKSDGSLPRKTFSMGHANDKRYYIEARKIK